MVNSAKLKGRLRELEMTQAYLAIQVGIAQSTMNQKINGERPFFLDEAMCVARILRISDSDFSTYFFTKDSA